MGANFHGNSVCTAELRGGVDHACCEQWVGGGGRRLNDDKGGGRNISSIDVGSF